MTYLVDANVLSEPTKPVPSSKIISRYRPGAEVVVDRFVVTRGHGNVFLFVKLCT